MIVRYLEYLTALARERVLTWAHRVLAGYSGLEQELSELREGLEGQIRLGAIPVSLPSVAILTAAFTARHPRTRFQITSLSSVEIQRGLDEFTIDAGITYLDNEPLVRVRTQPLYRERYVLVTHDRDSFAGLQSISWLQAATLPLARELFRVAGQINMSAQIEQQIAQ